MEYMIYNVDHMRKPGSEKLGEFEELVLLAVVRLGEDAYGAAIRRLIEERTERAVSISPVYTTLDRMEEKGYVRSRIGEPTSERGGRRRKFFSMLPPGVRVLKSSMRGYKRMIQGLEEEIEAL